MVRPAASRVLTCVNCAAARPRTGPPCAWGLTQHYRTEHGFLDALSDVSFEVCAEPKHARRLRRRGGDDHREQRRREK
jgi:hypothetical protein